MSEGATGTGVLGLAVAVGAAEGLLGAARAAAAKSASATGCRAIVLRDYWRARLTTPYRRGGLRRGAQQAHALGAPSRDVGDVEQQRASQHPRRRGTRAPYPLGSCPETGAGARGCR